MEAKVICFLCVLACVVLVSRVTAFPSQDAEEVMDLHALDALTGDTAEGMERSRRIVGGIPINVGNSYRRGRRPPLYRPQWRPNNRAGGRGGYSPY